VRGDRGGQAGGHTLKAQRVNRLQLYSFFKLVARWGGWLSHPGHFTPRKETQHALYKSWWAPGLVRMGA